jgi:hypothetical protein
MSVSSTEVKGQGSWEDGAANEDQRVHKLVEREFSDATTQMSWRVHPELGRKVKSRAHERGMSMYALLQEIALEYVIWYRDHRAPSTIGSEIWMAPRHGDPLQGLLLTDIRDELDAMAPEHPGVNIQYTALIHYARRRGWLEQLPNSSPEPLEEFVLGDLTERISSNVWMHHTLAERLEERMSRSEKSKQDYHDELIQDWLQMRRPITRLFFEYPSAPRNVSADSVRCCWNVQREIHHEIQHWAEHDYVTASHAYRAALVYHLERG